MQRTRLQRCFQDLRARRGCAFCVFLTAGDPSPTCSQQLLEGLEGVDLLEIGMPFSDPVADGETIQRSSARALAAGTKLKDVLRIAHAVRASKPDLPIVLMGYANPIYRFSLSSFAEQASASGVDGVILVDLPPEEDAACRIALKQKGIVLVRLATPTSDDERMKKICSEAEGFVYVVSVAGTTGKKQADEQQLRVLAQRLRRHTDLPLVAGFGVRDEKRVAMVARYFEGVVVGSTLVDEVGESVARRLSCEEALQRVQQRIGVLRRGLPKEGRLKEGLLKEGLQDA